MSIPTRSMWPTQLTFKQRWPHLAFDLLVAAWKINETLTESEVLQVDARVLDPPVVSERDWHDLYAAELAEHAGLAADLTRGRDGLFHPEAVFRRAGCTEGEKAVLRGYLAGDEVRAIAQDLGWRQQTTSLVLANGLSRLAQLRSGGAPWRQGRRARQFTDAAGSAG